jgi:glycosyltransferase involved in cell wall biosynthesis
VIRVVNIITGLQTGGAERAMARLVAALDRDRFEPSVVSLGGDGPVGADLRSRDVPVLALGLSLSRPSPVALGRLLAHLRHARPAVVQTWLYHADLVGGLAARAARTGPVIWNIRHGLPDADLYSRHAIVAARAGARLSSRVPTRVVSVSHAAVDAHVAFGYSSDRFVVIPNGVDLAAFTGDEPRRRAARAALGVDEATFVIGLVARYHPHKDHRTFLDALDKVAGKEPGVIAFLIGAGTEELAGEIDRRGLVGRCRVLGHRSDVADITPAFDLAVSSSIDEGLPNSVAEAMACGVPCVVTDVGDSARLVGSTGLVVPHGDPDALAAAMMEMVWMTSAQRRARGEDARQRVATHFSMPSMVTAYEDLYAEVSR